MVNKCWICDEKCEGHRDGYVYMDCYRCGKYKVEWELSEDEKLKDPRMIANASGWVSDNQNLLINRYIFEVTAHALNQ